MKKILFRIQLISLAITLIMYFSIYLGLIGQLALGVIQLISAAILLSRWKTLNRKLKNAFSIYGISLLLPASIALYNFTVNIIPWTLITGLVLSMLIAIYFTWLTYLVMKDSTPYRRKRGNFNILDFPEE